MIVLSSVLCDAAADYNGKLCIMGTFDTVRVRKFPALHPHCALALRFVFQANDVGLRRFQISFIDSEGRRILPEQSEPRFEMNIAEIPAESYFLSQNFVVNLQGLPLPRPSIYSFDIQMDGQIVARVPLLVPPAESR